MHEDELPGTLAVFVERIQRLRVQSLARERRSDGYTAQAEVLPRSVQLGQAFGHQRSGRPMDMDVDYPHEKSSLPLVNFATVCMKPSLVSSSRWSGTATSPTSR